MFRRLMLLCGYLSLCGSFTSLVVADEVLRTAVDHPVDILHIRLDLDVSIETKTVSGTATIDFQPNREVSSLSLDAAGLEVSRVERIQNGDSAPLEYSNTGEKLLVTYREPLARGQQERLAVTYRVHDPESGLHFFGPSAGEPETPWMVWSHGETNANHHWFPCVDHPSERQTTEIIARVPVEYTVLSNGSLLEQKKFDDGKRIQFHWKQSKPHSIYLVTLVAGRFAVVREEWNNLPVTYYVSPDRESEALSTFGRTREMLDFFSERFGDYPWEKYAQVAVEQFVAGGMENTSATTMNENILRDETALLDSNSDRIIAHELGHQWWGDLVTCKDWSHLWLNEGFATYCEVLWYEHSLGPDDRDYLLYSKSRSARTGSPLERPIVDRHYPTARSMYDSRSYPKGGWVLHMLRSRLGDDDFFRGLKRYGVVFAYQNAETSDLRQVFERLYGISLERFFYDWTERPGNPQLTVKSVYDPNEQLMRINIQQAQKEDPFHFPLEIELTGAGPDGEPIVNRVSVTEKEQTLLVPVNQRPNLIRVDPNFTLLAEIKEEKDIGWWKAQLTAPSVAERLRAIEYLTSSKEHKHHELLATVLREDPFYGVRIEAARQLATTVNKTSEDALLAGLAQSDPRVRNACAAGLAKFKQNDRVREVLLSKEKEGDPSDNVTAAVLRSLAAVCEEIDADRFLAALEQDSHSNVIRQAALYGLSKSKDPKAFETIIEWTNPDHSRDCRTTAIFALSAKLRSEELPPEQKEPALSTLEHLLEDPGPRVRTSAITALSSLPDLPKPLNAKIAKLSTDDTDKSVRDAADRALKRLNENSSESKELGALRSSLEQLKKQNAELEKRLEQLEKK